MTDTRPVLDWDDLALGTAFGPVTYDVTPERVATYRQAIGDHEVEHVDGEAVAPPTLLTFPVLKVLEHRHQARPGLIHGAQTIELLAPVRVGARLEATGVVVDRQVKRGRRWFSVDVTITDDRGTVVARARNTGVFP